MRKAVNLRNALQWGIGLSAGAIWLAAATLCLSDWRTQIPGTICLLFLAAVALTVCAWAIHRMLFCPMDDLTDVVINWRSTVPEDLEKRIGAIPGPAGELGGVFYGQMAEVERSMAGIRELTGEETERTVRAEIAEDICRSALPQVLQEYPSREHFKVAGLVRRGKREYCVFYDYFYIDPGLLCVSIGQVPEQSVASALYMVVAQTTLRSRIRLGRSVAETMSDVNAQMFDYGAGGEIRALVGTLDTAMGVFSFVNAGMSMPLIMRDGERYERLDTSVSTPLGRVQDVNYRVEIVRLKQGNRLFFHTEGLAAAENQQGIAFGTQELRSALIRSLSRKDPEQSLQFLANEAAAFCPADDAHPGYAALLLEYRKGEQQLERCRVPGTPENAGSVQSFLKTQLEDNGIRPKEYAWVAVLTDELFSLCCQMLKNGEDVTVECGVAPDAQSMTIRMSAPLHGQDPLSADQNGACSPVVEYIRNHGDYISFKPGEDEDTISIVCFL